MCHDATLRQHLCLCPCSFIIMMLLQAPRDIGCLFLVRGLIG